MRAYKGSLATQNCFLSSLWVHVCVHALFKYLWNNYYVQLNSLITYLRTYFTKYISNELLTSNVAASCYKEYCNIGIIKSKDMPD